MVDLFNLLKEFLRAESEVIAAFAMGILVALIFLFTFLFWLFNRWYGGKISNLESDLKEAKTALDEWKLQGQDAKKDLAEAKRKSKERKSKLDEQAKEIQQLTAKLDAESLARANDEDATQGLQEKLKTIGQQHASMQAEWKKERSMLLGKNQRLAKNAEAKLKSHIDQITALKKQINALNEDAKRIEKLQGQLWDVPAVAAKVSAFRPLRQKDAPIIAVTNLKGGVGKTTLTANIAVTYCQKPMDKRVLVIDLDFQASLTNLCLPAELVSDLQLGYGKFIDHAFVNPTNGLAMRTYDNLTQTRVSKLRLLAASENLANVEEQAKARWLMNRDQADVRSILRSALHDPLFQENFDIILIDCPPRWTTSSINAIACSDYVLIPTQLDRVSAEAVPRLLAWLKNLRASSAELYSHFEILGVIGNLAFNREGLIAQERTIWDALPEKCAQAWLAPVNRFDTIIRDKNEFRRAANNREFAALLPTLQPTFVKLVEEIEARRSAHEGR